MHLHNFFTKQDLNFTITSKQKWMLVNLFIGYFVLLGLLYGIDTVRASHRERERAYQVAQEFVAKKLVLPSTVQFPPQTDNGIQIEQLDKNRYLVSGYLFSQNTFGNEQRSDYMCILRYMGDGEWSYEKIWFE